MKREKETYGTRSGTIVNLSSFWGITVSEIKGGDAGGWRSIGGVAKAGDDEQLGKELLGVQEIG